MADVPKPIKPAHSGLMKALERRMAKHELNDEDLRLLELSKKLYHLRKEGATYAECGRAVGQTDKQVRQFMARGQYARFIDYMRACERGDDEKQVEKVVREAKHEFAKFAPDAIEYYRSCYLKDDDGNWLDDGKAQWATEKVSKGLGLTEPEHAVRPVVQIGQAFIVNEMKMVDADDALARGKVIDVTPEPAQITHQEAPRPLERIAPLDASIEAEG